MSTRGWRERLWRFLEPPEALAAMADIEKKLTRAREDEQTLQLALEAASEYLWDGDLVTGRISGSPQAGEWLGYPPAEWPPTPWDVIVHEEDRNQVNQVIRDTILGKTRTYRVRHRLRRKDGTVLHAVSTGVVVRDAAGKASRFVGFVRDVTHEVEEEGRRVQVQKLEGLGLLAGGIAHDFNNLLTVVGSSLEVALQRAQRGGEDVIEPLRTASLAVTRATVLTRQLLAYAGKAPIAHSPVDLNDVVGSIGDLLAISVPRKVTLRRELDGKLPAVQGDVAQLQQVVMNLITNAAEAIGDAEGTVTLRTQRVDEASSSGPRVRLTVTDTGAGMSAEVQQRIFDPFFSTKGSGRGLGLAALAGILKTHSGTISLESALGAGTTFTVDLPALSDPLPKSQPVEAKRSAKLALKVLLVDDEALLRRSGRRVLESLGCTVDEAATGRQAVNLVRLTPNAWHLVLMDVTMPEMSGTEAAAEMRKLAPELPIILSSGYTREEPAAADLVWSLPKPYTIEQLEEVLGKATGRSPAR